MRAKLQNKESQRIVNFSIIIILFNFGIEYFILLFESRNIIIPIQTGVNTLFLLIVLSRTYKLPTTPFTKLVAFITIYSLIVCLFSSSIIDSINLTLKFVIPLFFIIVGYHYIRSLGQLRRLLKVISIVLLIFILSFIFYNTFNVGESLYEDGVKTGYMNINAYYLICYVWIAALFFDPGKNLYQIILLTLSAIIMFVILKRTIILLIMIALIVYFRKNLNVRRTLSLSIILAIGFLIFNIYFSSFFNASFQSRESRFEENYSLENESRFQENVLPFLYIQDNYPLYLLGTGEPYNDQKYHLKYLKVDRQLHNSFARLFWNGGSILLFTFLYLVYKQLKILNKYRKQMTKNKSVYNIIYFLIVFIILRFISEMSSGITYISYNMFSYLIIGAAIGILNRERMLKKKKGKTSLNGK